MILWYDWVVMLRLKGAAKSGFTIVELLIVVVVIAILAAITLVTYGGIQQRANNAAMVDAVSKSIRMIQAYVAANGTYPFTGGYSCITVTTGCGLGSSYDTNTATMKNNLATIGTQPLSVPLIVAQNGHYGIIYNYTATRTMEGQIQPALLEYYLSGTSQQCGVAGVANNGWATLTLSTSGFTSNDSGGHTVCFVSIPGPTV